LQNSFGEPFWGLGLKIRSFGAIVLGKSFGEQLVVATLGGSFWERLCRMALGSRFSFGEQLWGAAPGTTLGSSFREQL